MKTYDIVLLTVSTGDSVEETNVDKQTVLDPQLMVMSRVEIH